MIGLTQIKDNIQTIGLVLAGVALLGMAGTIAIQHANLKAANEALSSEKDKRMAAEIALTDNTKRFNAQIANIKTLDAQRQQAQTATDPFYIRLDQIETPTKDENHADTTLADRLNGLNADTNRMLSDGAE